MGTRQFLIGAIICAVFVIGSLLGGSTGRRRLPEGEMAKLRRETRDQEKRKQENCAAEVLEIQKDTKKYQVGHELRKATAFLEESKKVLAAQIAEGPTPWAPALMTPQQINDRLKANQASEKQARQRHDDEQRRKKEKQQMRSQQESTTEEQLRAIREKEERGKAIFEDTQELIKRSNAETKAMKLDLAREKAAKAEKIRNDEKRAEEMPTQSEPSRLSLKVAFSRKESTTITVSGHETDESDGTRTCRRSDSTIEVDLWKANGMYSTKTPSITTRFVKDTRKAKTAVIFKPDSKQPNCPNGWYI